MKKQINIFAIAVCTNFGAGPLLSSPIFGAGRLAGEHVASA
jgi:hypothetical protein